MWSKIKSRAYKEIKLLAIPIIISVVGYKVICNICGWKDSSLMDSGWHKKIICPKCSSQVRHRLYWHAIQSAKNNVIRNSLSTESKVLHFAPDKCISQLIRSKVNSYHTADYFAKGYNYENIDYNIDLSNMSEIPDNSYDCLLAFDVLEHVKDDTRALNEVYRILKPNGICALTIPQKDHLAKTEEDLSELSDQDRERKFGQYNHWRIYGNDFNRKLENAGFRAIVYDHSEIETKEVAKHVLYPPKKSDHSLATNERKIYFGVKS